MELKIKDLAKIIKKTEKEILNLIKENKIPYYTLNNQYYFNKAEITEWLLRTQTPINGNVEALYRTGHTVNLTSLIEKGGIYYSLEGSNILDVLKNVVEIIPIPKETNKQAFLQALVAREDMMPTTIGKGVAIPHPRTPLITEPQQEQVSLCFLKNKIQYKAPDSIPISILFLPLSSTPRRHLEILSKISRLCADPVCMQVLEAQCSSEVILKHIDECEKKWEKQL